MVPAIAATDSERQNRTSGRISEGPEQQLTRHVGELVLQRTDICDVDVEERAELGHRHADAGDGDVGQAAAAVH